MERVVAVGGWRRRRIRRLAPRGNAARRRLLSQDQVLPSAHLHGAIVPILHRHGSSRRDVPLDLVLAVGEHILAHADRVNLLARHVC